MSNPLGAIYRVPSGSTGDTLGLPTFEDVAIDREGLTTGLSGFYNGVVALAIKQTTEIGTTQILTGIRTDTNETHPGVVSVPTEVRSMEAIAASLEEGAVLARPDANTITFRGDNRVFDRTRHCYASNIGELATHTLAIKLNLGDKVEDLVVGGAQFQYQNLYLGYSRIGYDPESDEDILEAIVMLNIGVTIPPGYNEIFPHSTRELTSLTWVDDTDFARGFASRRASDFFGDQLDDAATVEVCVHGLCLTTTALAIGTTHHE